MAKDRLETIVREYVLDAFLELEPSSIVSAAQIQRERLIDETFRYKHNFYFTSDFLMYTIENGELMLYVSSLPRNLIIRNMSEAVKQITKIDWKKDNGYTYYKPLGREVLEVIDSVKTGETLRIKVSDLDLYRVKEEISSFVIPTFSKKENNSFNYDCLNSSQRELAEKIHGQGQDFIDVMAMLNNNGIKETKVYLLNPDLMRRLAANNPCCFFFMVRSIK